MMTFHRGATVLLSSVLVLLGAALLVQTARVGGGIGYFIGALILVAGAGRLYVSRR
jgi:hypothetical protein